MVVPNIKKGGSVILLCTEKSQNNLINKINDYNVVNSQVLYFLPGIFLTRIYRAIMWQSGKEPGKASSLGF